MRGIVTIVLLVTIGVVLSGMGNMGGTPEGTVPNAPENFKVQLIDRAGVTTELSRFSMEGKVFFEGELGEGTMSVSFLDIKEISFGAAGGNLVTADLLLDSGRRIQLKLHNVTMFYGVTGDGAYKISVRNISRIVFLK